MTDTLATLILYSFTMIQISCGLLTISLSIKNYLLRGFDFFSFFILMVGCPLGIHLFLNGLFYYIKYHNLGIF